jgi:hypothetical protein
MNDELEKMWHYLVMATSERYPGICLELRKAIKNLEITGLPTEI